MLLLEKFLGRTMAAALKSLADFVSRIERRAPNSAKAHLYRGHDVAGHKMSPSLLREKGNRRHEKNIFRELLAIHPTEFADDRGVFEQLVRMQHFSLPTRLLDITYNPLVALYFACKEKQGNDGELLRIDVSPSDIRYFDSDTVSVIANLSNLSGNERDALRKMKSDADVAASPEGKRLLQFIKAEKPYFEPLIQASHLKGVFAVKPRQTNRRLLAQQGAFLIFGLNGEISDDNSMGINVTRTPIPRDIKPKIISALDRINVNASTIFPDIESAAKYIMSKVSAP